MRSLKYIRDLAKVLTVSLMCVTTAQAAAVLYYRDSLIGVDNMGAALSASAHSVTQATSQSEFRALVENGGWDLVIYFQQVYSSSTGADTAMANWVTGGGRAIFADWERNTDMGALFGASYTDTNGQTEMTFTNPALGTVSLNNPGWDTFSMGLSAFDSSEVMAHFANGQAAVVSGNSGRTILNGFLNDTLPAEVGISVFSSQIEHVLAAQVHSVPEPDSVALCAFSLGLLLVCSRRRERCAPCQPWKLLGSRASATPGQLTHSA